MSGDGAIFLSLLIPLGGAGLIALNHDRPNLREAVTLGTAGALFLTALSLLPAVMAGDRPNI